MRTNKSNFARINIKTQFSLYSVYDNWSFDAIEKIIFPTNENWWWLAKVVSIIFHPNERLCSFNYSKSSVVACSSNRVERERKIELTDLNEARSYYRNLIRECTEMESKRNRLWHGDLENCDHRKLGHFRFE